MVFVGSSVGGLQSLLEAFITISASHSLTIDSKKIVLIKSDCRGSIEFSLNEGTVSTHHISTQRYIFYFNRWIDASGELTKEIYRRFSCSMQVLRQKMIGEDYIKNKATVFRSSILPEFFYGCETWSLTEANLIYIKNRLGVLRKSSKLKNDAKFDIENHILLEKACWIREQLQNKDSACSYVLREFGSLLKTPNLELAKEMWFCKLIEKFRTYNKDESKTHWVNRWKGLLDLAENNTEFEKFIQFLKKN